MVGGGQGRGASPSSREHPHSSTVPHPHSSTVPHTHSSAVRRLTGQDPGPGQGSAAEA